QRRRTALADHGRVVVRSAGLYAAGLHQRRLHRPLLAPGSAAEVGRSRTVAKRGRPRQSSFRWVLIGSSSSEANEKRRILETKLATFYVATLTQSQPNCLRTARSLFGSSEDRYPVRGTFLGCCASRELRSAKNITHRAKLPSFRLSISPHTSRTTVLVLCLNLGRTYTFHCRRKSQAGLEMVVLSCQCLVLVRSGLGFNQRVRSSSLGGSPNLSNGWVETTWGRKGFTDFATTLPELYDSMCSNR